MAAMGAPTGQQAAGAFVAVTAAAVLASHVPNLAGASCDAAVARVLAFEPQPFRALDVLAGNLLSVVPVGTQTTRAALGTCLVAAWAATLVYDLSRSLLSACAPLGATASLIAAIAALTPIGSVAWQTEGAAVGGAVLGAALILAPIAAMARSVGTQDATRWPGVAVGLALAIGHEPWTGGCALAGSCTFIALHGSLRQRLARAWRRDRGAIGFAFAGGLVPAAIAVGRTIGAGTLEAGLSTWSGERGATPAPSVVAFLGDQIGVCLAALAVAGAILATLLPRARPHVGALGAILFSGLAAALLGAPRGPDRFGAPVLASLAATAALAGVAMQAAVRAVAASRLPFARASAAMIVVLECALPVATADEALVRVPRREADQESAAAAWDDLAWATLPPETVALVVEPRLYAAAVAARAQGAVRGDILLVPDLGGHPPPWRDLASDPALVSVWRDIALSGAPTEGSLSSLATRRPLAVAGATLWSAAVARHFVPLPLFVQFEPEPRGASDRRRAADSFARERAALGPFIARDPDLRPWAPAPAP